MSSGVLYLPELALIRSGMFFQLHRPPATQSGPAANANHFARFVVSASPFAPQEQRFFHRAKHDTKESDCHWASGFETMSASFSGTLNATPMALIAPFATRAMVERAIVDGGVSEVSR